MNRLHQIAIMKTAKSLPLAICVVMACAYLVVMGTLTFNPSAPAAETGNKHTNSFLIQTNQAGCRAEASDNRGVLLVHKNVLISL